MNTKKVEEWGGVCSNCRKLLVDAENKAAVLQMENMSLQGAYARRVYTAEQTERILRKQGCQSSQAYCYYSMECGSYERTRRRHLRKAQQAVGAVLDEVAPNQPGELWHSLVPSLNKQFSSDSESEDEDLDNVLMNALTECYSNASTWDTRRQILSIMADKVTFRTLKKWIPGLTRVTTPGVILNLRKNVPRSVTTGKKAI
ncbi:hypothetical protein ACROYT_G022855 [Oculina patagonica]